MKRPDGRLIRTLSPFVQMMPYIMERRSDAQNFTRQTVPVEPLREYLKKKRDEGHTISMLHFFIALYVRLLALRPQLNRFVMNGRYYARPKIWISMAIKRDLSDDGEETTVKFCFEGTETLFQVAEKVESVLNENLRTDASNSTDRVAGAIMGMPRVLIRSLMGLLKWLDRRNLLPAALIEASPFHTSLFFTYLKSINLDYIYHHLYDFGTTGIFVALGKDKMMPLPGRDGQVEQRRCCEIGYVLDERICDGFYFARSFHLLNRYLEHPELLEEGLEARVQDQS